ncbi:hypothetical protein GEMRC1_003618 [Eukaryota sp. GEM-RC1]
MLPLFYSEKSSEVSEGTWYRGGTNVCYYQNNLKRKQGSYHYTLSFCVVPDHNDDVIHFAHCYPYTYTDLRLFLRSLDRDPAKRNRFRRRVLCKTIGGNNCDMLTITSFSGDPEALKQRRGIVISARVHPGETNSSFMMHGIIDFLTGSSMDARILRDNFVFKIIPMLNPDGVVVGNYRCNLAGQDLNRHWMDPSKKLNTTIFNAKQMVKRFSEDRDVLLYLDLHGHSRKKNIFIYGCENRLMPELRLVERVFPRLLASNAPAFSFGDCSFRVQKSKQNSARVVVWKEFNILNSFTMEASFCGASIGPQAGHHFTQDDLKDMGRAFVNAIKRELELLFPLKNGNSDEVNPVDNGYESDSSEEERIVDKKKKKKGKKSKKKSSKKDYVDELKPTKAPPIQFITTLPDPKPQLLTSLDSNETEGEIRDSQSISEKTSDQYLSDGFTSDRSNRSSFSNLSEPSDFSNLFEKRSPALPTPPPTDFSKRILSFDSLSSMDEGKEPFSKSLLSSTIKRRAQSATKSFVPISSTFVPIERKDTSSQPDLTDHPPPSLTRKRSLTCLSEVEKPFSVVTPKLFESSSARLPPIPSTSSVSTVRQGNERRGSASKKKGRKR